MEQTRENYYKMMAFGMAAITVGAVVGVWLPPVFKAVVPFAPGRQGLFDFVMIVFSVGAVIGGLRAALAIQAHWLPKCEMSKEKRENIEKNVLPCRETLDRVVMWLAGGCVLVVLFNYL